MAYQELQISRYIDIDLWKACISVHITREKYAVAFNNSNRQKFKSKQTGVVIW